MRKGRRHALGWIVAALALSLAALGVPTRAAADEAKKAADQSAARAVQAALDWLAAEIKQRSMVVGETAPNGKERVWSSVVRADARTMTLQTATYSEETGRKALYTSTFAWKDLNPARVQVVEETDGPGRFLDDRKLFLLQFFTTRDAGNRIHFTNQRLTVSRWDKVDGPRYTAPEMNIAYAEIPFPDKAQAERVAKVFAHAIRLAGDKVESSNELRATLHWLTGAIDGQTYEGKEYRNTYRVVDTSGGSLVIEKVTTDLADAGKPSPPWAVRVTLPLYELDPDRVEVSDGRPSPEDPFATGTPDVSVEAAYVPGIEPIVTRDAGGKILRRERHFHLSITNYLHAKRIGGSARAPFASASEASPGKRETRFEQDNEKVRVPSRPGSGLALSSLVLPGASAAQDRAPSPRERQARAVLLRARLTAQAIPDAHSRSTKMVYVASSQLSLGDVAAALETARSIEEACPDPTASDR